MMVNAKAMVQTCEIDAFQTANWSVPHKLSHTPSPSPTTMSHKTATRTPSGNPIELSDIAQV